MKTLSGQIQTIHISQLLPEVFVGAMPDGGLSEVWLQEVDFRSGSSVLIEAGSGRGKSSLCAFLCGLRHDYRGSIRYLGSHDTLVAEGDATEKEDVRRMLGEQLRRQHIAVLFQEHRLFPELSAFDNVMLKNQLTHHFSAGEIRQMLARLGLSNRIDTPCGRLSLGQQQRVAFVRALCQPSSFLLLDEPVSHLDDENAEVMASMLRERQAADGIGLIVTSIGRRLPYEYDSVLRL